MTPFRSSYLVRREPKLEDSRLLHDVGGHDDVAAAVDDAEDGQGAGAISVNVFGVGHPRAVPSFGGILVLDDF